MAREKRSLMRNIGSFFGHLRHGVRTPVEGETRHELRREHEREERIEDGKKIVLRRTTIEEMEVRPDPRRRATQDRDEA